MDEEGNFKEKVANLLPFRKITSTTQLTAFIKKVSQAWDINQICPECANPQEIGSRTEAKKLPQKLRYPCASCERDIKKLYEKPKKKRLLSYRSI